MESFKEDTDVFEITDFTTASDWERFVAALEEIFNDWKLANRDRVPALEKDDLAYGIWKQDVEQVSFADFKFTLTRHYMVPNNKDQNKSLKQSPSGSREDLPDVTKGESPIEDDEENPLPAAFIDMMNSTNDFPGKAHCLVRWYGIRDFVILACATSGESVSSESRVKILLSSINVAINNTGCTVPIFLEVDRPQRQLYSGICEGAGMRIDFDMACLKRIPHQLHYMSGLVDMFQKKMGCSITSTPKITVAVRFTHIFNDWPAYMTPCPVETEGETEVDYKRLHAGCMEDPIRDLIVSTTWPRVDSIMVADSDVYSDLDPMNAPQWHLRVAFVDQPRCNLWESIRQYIKLCKRRETMNDLFRSRTEDHSAGGQASNPQRLSKAFERLTESRVQMPNITNAVLNATSGFRRRKMENAPLPDFYIEELMEYIFSEQNGQISRLNEEKEQAAAKADPEPKGQILTTSTTTSLDIDFHKTLEKQLKCAPFSSITHRLAICLNSLNRDSGGIYAVAQLWQEVLMELRTRWEAGLYIPDLNGRTCDEAPDLGTSLFHQKLQMINCCISRKLAREAPHASEASEIEWTEAKEEISEEEDEFFECNQDVPSGNSSPSLPSEYRPVGRKHRFGSLSLLNHPDEPLCVPYTQDTPPLTEDTIEEQTKQLAGLGTSEESASLRARMQCASLVSDMESFKAANPKSGLEDFVRWYSPRDFIADPGGQGGKLSQRMEVSGNLWVEAWETAKHVPARLQKRLFDDTAEAEKVFRFLEDLTPAHLSLTLFPNILAEAIVELDSYARTCAVQPPDVNTLLDSLRERASLATRQVDVGSTIGAAALSAYDEVLRRVAHTEVVLSRAKSLEVKFMRDPVDPVNADCINSILRQCLTDTPDVALVGAARGPMGHALRRLIGVARGEGYEDSSQASSMGFQDSGLTPVETFSEDNMNPHFPEPAGKEYILRSEVPLPSQYSRIGPQRLYCAIQREDYRLCGAFSRDTMFF